MQTATLEGGFQAPAQQAAQAFRAIMTVMARPGHIAEVSGAVPPAPVSIAAGTALLTLCDPETGIYLAGAFDTLALRQWISFHIGAPLVPADKCDFALGTWADLAPLGAYRIGTSEYPDRSATLIVEMDALSEHGATLKGPGIKDTAVFGLPETAAFQANHQLFPLGMDFFFTCETQIAALPRSTEVL